MAAVAAAQYLPSLSYQFLNWDDDRYVLQNPWIRSWSAGNLTHVLTKPYFNNFLPLHLLSYMVDYSLWGLNPFGYHLQSVLLHALNAALALLVVRALFGGMAAPVIAALLFAVHPSHVEAVAWISIRKDLLSTSFALLSVLFYLRAVDRTPPRWDAYAGSVVCFGLGLLSKVSIVTLPLFLLLVDLVPRAGAARRPWRWIFLDKAPYGLLGLALVRLNAMAQTTAQASYAKDALAYLMVKGHAVWIYLGLLFAALRGNPDYDLPALAKDPGTVLIALSGLLVVPLAAWLGYRFRRRAVALGAAWIVVTLIPALAFPLVTYMADRYLYLPSLGFCWMAAAAIAAAAARMTGPRWRTAALAALAAVPTVAFAARTLQDLPTWRDSESLWSYVITRSGDFRAYTNLAEVRLQQGRLDEAERLLRIAARVEDATTYQNLGVLYFQEGRLEDAEGAITHALGILRRAGGDREQASVLYYNLGAVYARRGDWEKTAGALEAALRENPSNDAARAQLERLRGAAPAR